MDSCISLQFVSMGEWKEDQSGRSDLETPFLLKKRTIHMSCFVIDFDPAGDFSNLTIVFIF